ncbi:YhjD/YihY/BrkB family envelope integrity protein [Streptomyces scabiei]|uniref:YhjD/YihY/BrkB family envelope integrity protein n=1 Tax=Streptomyces scabiei TaxID=1930 RepID=UPI0029A1180E|nr:YhjD/YihY/BrkB family envelope integrity protein [Streptomyces scabiei]MDX3112408.1 YhjD/YihY/BrkB family envelope integrity protein [Streptomyces scabiei]
MQPGAGPRRDRPARPSRRERWRARGATAGARLRLLRARAESRFPVITHLVTHLVSVNVLDSATRLAAQTFLTAVPLLFVVAAVAPQSVRDHLADSLSDAFGLTGSSKSQLEQVLKGDTNDLRQTTGIVGGLMVLISATACSRAMQRLCQRAWSLPKAAARTAAWRWIVWLPVWLIMIVVQGVLRDGFGVGPWLGVPLLFVADTLLWWWTQHLLLAARVPWRPLLPGALLTGAALTALTSAAHLYVPRALNHSLQRYGSLGAVFTLLSWLIALCVAVTLCITAGAVIAREPAVARRLGRPESPGPATGDTLEDGQRSTRPRPPRDA